MGDSVRPAHTARIGRISQERPHFLRAPHAKVSTLTLALVLMTTLLEPSLADLDFEHDIPCACHKLCNPLAHPAQWWVTLSCGCPYPMCQQALRIANVRLKVRTLTCRLCKTDQIRIRDVVRI